MRVYADTSVFGGVFDEEFTEDSRKFFEEVKTGKFELVVSALVEEEVQSAPEQVREFFDEFSLVADIAEIDETVLVLRDAYLNAGIVTKKSTDDATHVALAVGVVPVETAVLIGPPIKAVTYHDLSVERRSDGTWMAHVVFDV